MGWTYSHGATLKGLMKELTEGWERHTDQYTITAKCLKHCYRMSNPGHGVLWTVWEHTFTLNGQTVQPASRWIGCDLVEYAREFEGFGYKGLSESCGPNACSCPLSYLDMVPVVSQVWRDDVREYHRLKAEKRARKKEATAEFRRLNPIYE